MQVLSTYYAKSVTDQEEIKMQNIARLNSFILKHYDTWLDIFLPISIGFGAFVFFQFSLSPQHFFFADDWAILYKAEFDSFFDIISNQFLPTKTYNDRPVGILFDWLVYNIFGLNNVACHSAILVVHILNSILLFFFLKQIYKSSIYGFVGGVIFSIYFAGDMSVIWFGDPADLIAGTFVLLTVFFYIKVQNKYLFVSAIFYFFAMRSKEITIPLIMILTLGEIFQCFEIGTAKNKNISVTISKAIDKLKFHYLVFFLIFFKLLIMFYSEWGGINKAFPHAPFNIREFTNNVSWFIWRLFYLDFSSTPLAANQFLFGTLCLLLFCWYTKKYLAVLSFLAAVVTVIPMAIFLPNIKTQHILYVPTIYMSIMAVSILHSRLWVVKIVSILFALTVYYVTFTSEYRLGTITSTIKVTSEFKRSFDSIRRIFPQLKSNTDIYILNIPGPFNLFDYGSTFGGSFAMKILYHDPSLKTIVYKTEEEVQKLYSEDTNPKAILSYQNNGSLILLEKEM